MSALKDRIKRLLGPRLMSWYNRLRLRLQVVQVFRSDLRRYRRCSAYFHPDRPAALELQIAVLCHSLEKGFLHEGDRMRPRFGRAKVRRLLDLLEEWRSRGLPERSPIRSAEEILSAYYSYHRERGIDISDCFSEEEYARLSRHSDRPVVTLTGEEQEEGRRGDFRTFARSRHSVRRFSSRPIPEEELRKAVELASTAPSACNRQEVSVRFVTERETVDTILELQGGFGRVHDGIDRLLLVTVDLSATYMEGTDRHQPYIDGGIYLMNLLYALHYYGLSACAGNASLLPRDEQRVLRLAHARPSEALIAIVPVGYAAEPTLVTPSKRRPAEETLYI